MIAVSPVVLTGVRTAAIVVGLMTAVSAANPAATEGSARGPVSPRAATRILGAAWYVDNTPIPQARLRLRNLASGRIETTAVADDAGQFTFSDIDGGTYVIELVDASGKVLTVGHPFIVAPGETVATFVRLGARVPWFSGFFKDAAAAAIATAAGEGITALAPVARPISAKR